MASALERLQTLGYPFVRVQSASEPPAAREFFA